MLGRLNQGHAQRWQEPSRPAVRYLKASAQAAPGNPRFWNGGVLPLFGLAPPGGGEGEGPLRGRRGRAARHPGDDVTGCIWF